MESSKFSSLCYLMFDLGSKFLRTGTVSTDQIPSISVVMTNFFFEKNGKEVGRSKFAVFSSAASVVCGVFSNGLRKISGILVSMKKIRSATES